MRPEGTMSPFEKRTLASCLAQTSWSIPGNILAMPHRSSFLKKAAVDSGFTKECR